MRSIFKSTHPQAVEAAADDLPGVLGVMKQHLEAQNSGERLRRMHASWCDDASVYVCVPVCIHSSPHGPDQN